MTYGLEKGDAPTTRAFLGHPLLLAPRTRFGSLAGHDSYSGRDTIPLQWVSTKMIVRQNDCFVLFVWSSVLAKMIVRQNDRLGAQEKRNAPK